MPAVAVTDTNNMFAALEFSVAATGAGIQPIVGCQVDLAYDPAPPGERARPPAPLVLLAQNEAGYLNLMKLNSCLYLDKGGELPMVTLEELAAHSDGLICLTGGPDGPVGRLLQQGAASQGAGPDDPAWPRSIPTGFMSNCSAIPAMPASPRPSG